MPPINADQIIRYSNLFVTMPFALTNLLKERSGNRYFKVGMMFALVAGAIYTIDQIEAERKDLKMQRLKASTASTL